MNTLLTYDNCYYKICHEVGLGTGLSSNLGVVSSNGCFTSVLDHTEISNAYFVCHCSTQEDVLKMHVLCVCEHIAGFCACVLLPTCVCHDC